MQMKKDQETLINPRNNGFRIQNHLHIFYVQNRGQEESLLLGWNKVVKIAKECFESNKV